MSFDLSKIGVVQCRMEGTQEGCQFGNLCTFRHGEETKEQAQRRQQAAYMAKKNGGGGSGGGGGGRGPVSPPRVQRAPVAPGAPSRETRVMSEFFPTLAQAGGSALRAWQKPSPPLFEGFYPLEDAVFLAKEQEVKECEMKLKAAREDTKMTPCEFVVIAETYAGGIKTLKEMRHAISARRAEEEALRERVLRERKEGLAAKGLPVSLAEHAKLGNWGDLAEEA